MNQANTLYQAQRIDVLDSLRGMAILGILLVNIHGFGLPFPAIDNPAIINDLSGPDYYVWLLNAWAIEGNSRSVLSMLFGAGMLLLLEKNQQRQSAANALFLRRQCWLLLFGLLHIYLLLWFWDILSMYAVCGMVLLAFKNLPVKKLLLAAVICLLITDSLETIKLYRKKLVIARGEKILQANSGLKNLTDADQVYLDAYERFRNESDLITKKKAAAEEVAKKNGSVHELYQLHVRHAQEMQISFFTFHIWDILLFMFIGMAFYRTGILQGNYPLRFYVWLAIGGFSMGLLLSWFRLRPLVENGFDEYKTVRDTSITFYETARAARSLGFFGLIMVLYKSGRFSAVFRWLQPVGQMAFTNYLFQSIFCGLFFYGIGGGMFGELSRARLLYVVFAIWILQVVYSRTWLRYFSCGPFEWIWRSLTYWKKQALKKEKKSATLAK